MSRLKDNPGLWKQFVPIAFHVDYWDRLGWRDRFSSQRWTERQRRYASLWQSESVYTPAVVVNGREQRGLPGASLSQPNEKQAGVLDVTTSDGKNFSDRVSTGERKWIRLGGAPRAARLRHFKQRPRGRKQRPQFAARFRCARSARRDNEIRKRNAARAPDDGRDGRNRGAQSRRCLDQRPRSARAGAGDRRLVALRRRKERFLLRRGHD